MSRLLWSPAAAPEASWPEPRRSIGSGNPNTLESVGSCEWRNHRRKSVCARPAAAAAAPAATQAAVGIGAGDAATDASPNGSISGQQQEEEEEEGENTRQVKADLRALLNVLSLKESDVMAELSKKNQELLHLGQEAVAEGLGEKEGLLGTGAGQEDPTVRR